MELVEVISFKLQECELRNGRDVDGVVKTYKLKPWIP